MNAVNGTVVALPEVYKSAGPEPTGYREVAEKVNALADKTETVAKFRQNVHGVPERVEKGHSPNTFIRDLFTCAWDAKLSATDRPSIDAAVQVVHEFLERSYGMVLFMPKTIGDFPKNWLETRDGGQPRGPRVELVRPGVRTRDNNLVCPAIVDQE